MVRSVFLDHMQGLNGRNESFCVNRERRRALYPIYAQISLIGFFTLYWLIQGARSWRPTSADPNLGGVSTAKECVTSL